MWGSTTGRRFDGPISDLIEMVDGTPVDVEGSSRAHATSVERTGDDRVRRGSGNVSFVDPFAPARIDGTVWKIVNGDVRPHRRGAARDGVTGAPRRRASGRAARRRRGVASRSSSTLRWVA
jgi:hypothetical protein